MNIHKFHCHYFILFLLISSNLFASQKTPITFKEVDAYAKSVRNITDIGKLSKKLTAPYSGDLEKVRSIFRWITENIAYDTKEYHQEKATSEYAKLFDKLNPATANLERVYRTELAKYVLAKKKATCDGYATLLKALCDSSSIKAEIVAGKAKTVVLQIGTVIKNNHTWNAVFIDGKWQLLDACWASGFCNDSITTFTKSFNEVYFLTSPSKFIMNHYPSDKKWMLTSSITSETQFYSYPIVHDGYFQNNISSFAPQKGIIEGKSGNKISFEFRKPDDDAAISVSTKTGNNNVKIKKQEKIVTYEYTFSSDKEDELTIYYNNQALFTYRIILAP